MQGEQRLIIATCEKGTVEDLNDMKDIKAGLDKIRDQHPNFVDMASKEVFRPTNAKSVADPLPARAGLDENRQRARRPDAKPQSSAHRHSARAEYLYLRAAVQRLLRKPRSAARKHHLLRLHQFRTLSRRRQPRRDRSLLPGEDWNLARLQPDSGKASQETAERDLLPDVRRAAPATGEDASARTPAPP